MNARKTEASIKIGEDKPIGELNVLPRTIFINDNLKVMRGMESGTIDLIATDPPFNKKKVFEAPIGSDAEGSSFSDKWTYDEIKESWVRNMEKVHPSVWNLVKTILATGDKSLASFIIYMHTRALEMHRILKPTGSLYLHCDQAAGHYLKIMLDCIFGKENFRNEIIWHYGKWTNASKHYQKNHDTILYYVKDTKSKYAFNKLFKEKRNTTPYHTNIIDGQGQLLIYDRKQTPDNIIEKYTEKGYKIVDVKNKGVNEHDVWSFETNKSINFLNSQSKERTGWPTQKPLALYERIISVSSNEGEIVLDPFCGCATTCVAAERLQRKWIGIDVSEEAHIQVAKRLAKSNVALETSKTIKREDFPVRETDITITPKKKLREILYLLQKGKCNHCKRECTPEQMSSFFDLDHIVPKSKGGHNGDSNMQLLCRSCNSSKGNKDDATAKARLEELEEELGIKR